jgi:hypothetical protein
MRHPGEAAEILLSAAPELDPEIVFASQLFLADKYVSSDGNWGYINSYRWNAFYTWLYEVGITPVNLTGRGFTNDFLP